MPTTRRTFLQRAGAAAAAAVAGAPLIPSLLKSAPAPSPGPIVIASGNGLEAVKKAMQVIQQGNDALDAVIAGVNINENDPNDTSVGYGGLPNEDGVVELDSAVMHGPNHMAGAVASLRNIKNPSKVARLVMERTDHVLLVGEGALRFAKAHGFVEENLLTEKAREEWLKWKENMSKEDAWLPVHADTTRADLIGEAFAPYMKYTGTIHCSAIDRNGNISCVTTTSGLAWKIAGRVGDSPIVGAGLYCDNEVGAAGSTGRGEANLISCNSVMIVEWMRAGKSPEEACLLACKRVVENNKQRRLQDDQGRPTFNVSFYALSRKGERACASVWEPKEYAVHDGREARLIPGAYLYRK
ncbi:MAG TPA: N(4)-(beta-N-acetylglucosaminyl)-L-asparaginase [Bacteroidota bacterium]|nr:N(4)-(beta-N-acetylglucosaminyl)-L-asparaginase [Bacteroidota bacterium]